MKYQVTNPDTVFGTVVREFSTESDALAWISICMQNGLETVVACIE